MLTALLLAATTLAQTKRDFSGIYLLKELRDAKGNLQPTEPPRILDIQQATDEIVVKAVRNGETAIAHFRFHNEKTDRVRARLKGNSIVIEVAGGNGFVPFVIEKWKLSADVQQLVIRHTPDPGSKYSEVYMRESTLEAAQKSATQIPRRMCDQPVLPYLRANSPEALVKYTEGIDLGFSSFQQITRCVSYDAALSGEFFKGLEIDKSSNQAEFRKKGKVISDFTGDVVLEVGTHPYDCSEGNMGWVPIGPREPEAVENLRFMVRWMGKREKDLSEVQAEFLSEPWRELSPPQLFYRMRIPAQDIPLTDDLEVLIFSKSGEQLACVKGHL